MGITKGIHGKTTIQIEEKKIQKGEGKEMGQKLGSMEKFLGMRKPEGGPCYESPKQEKVSHTFKHLV